MAARSDSLETAYLLQQANAGDRQSFDLLFARHRDGLEQMVACRLDPRLRGRLDPADVVQEAQLEAYRRLPDYLERRPMPFHLWLWKTTYERLLNLHRDHAAARRCITSERALPEQSSVLLAQRLFATTPSPSEEAMRREQAERCRQALMQLSEADQEILLLRYVDGLSNDEAAQMLEVRPDAASKRHGRALLRLHHLLRTMGLEEVL